jgi:thiosulfate/3-mercaptopyruvate sulfurtransferase
MRKLLVVPADLAANPHWRSVDCRHDLGDVGAGRRAYDAAHIPGAVHAHLDFDLSGAKTAGSGRHPLPDAERLCDWLGRSGISREATVVAYDEGSGAYAARLWWLLRWLGHDAVHVLDGGWAAWKSANQPVSDDAASYAALRYDEASPRCDLCVTAADLVNDLAEPRLQIVDARGEARYMGLEEPIDRAAGHIPGAVNRPYTQNLEAGIFKSAERLREEFMSLLKSIRSSAVIHQCGSGVTACHNLLAMEHAGLYGSRLYPGSWSEWCSDPQRPVATGR